MRAGAPSGNMKTRMVTVSGGTLSYHDIVLLQGHSAAAVSEKRLPYSEKYAVAHAQTIREAGSTPLLVMTWTKQEISKLADNTIRIANKAKMRAAPVGLAL